MTSKLEKYVGARLMRRIQHPETTYYGVCVLAAPGSWCRVGPTWRLPDGVWAVVGPGVRNWGTTQGLAELASSSAPRPGWHAAAASLCPEPQLVFAAVAGSAAMTGPEVAELGTEADSMAEPAEPAEVVS
jgi:hypothetical protein